MASRHFFSALWDETLKRIPYIAAVFVLLILIIGYKSYQNGVKNIEIARQNSETNNALLNKLDSQAQQIKELSEQNNKLAQQNATHIDCVAEIFARYTQDQTPIANIDLNNCIIATTNAPHGGAIPGTSNAPLSFSQSTTSKPASSSNQPTGTSSSNQTSTTPPSTTTSSPPPDNEGVIIDLPLLPPINIPSPL